jgi:lipopolysaccharide/colanic/teichoic acid biosynthesis glycosyltransferase
MASISLKRLFDVVGAACGLLLLSPVLLLLMFLVWRHDRHSPLYFAIRVGKDGRPFSMVKLRSMVADADSAGVHATKASDPRITPVGRFVRRFKLDELTQLWNVLRGEMSLVGPRPNVRSETDRHTHIERQLLQALPGLTDIASIVFSDHGEILEGQLHPHLAYNQLIRPGKNKLALFYLDHRSLLVDIEVCLLTMLAMISRRRALAGVQRLLRRCGASTELLQIASRAAPLVPTPPPGAEDIVTARSIDSLPPLAPVYVAANADAFLRREVPSDHR